MKLNGKIMNLSREFSPGKNFWKNKGEIITEKDKKYSFKYKDVKFDKYSVQEELNVSFDLTSNKGGNKVVKNIEKHPSDYGFLVSHNDRTHKGIFQTYEKENVEFSDFNVRDEDEPIFGSLYVFDTITTQKEKYDNSYYNVGKYSDSDIFEVGQIRNGTVKDITSFGGFMNIGHPISDGLLWDKEIVWTEEENPDPNKYLRVGQSLDVLITKIIDGDKPKISLSAKALIEPPKEIISHYRAVNIFRIDKMHRKIINEIVLEIAKREDILPEAKIIAINIIKDNPDLYKQHRNSTLPILYEYCKIKLLHHIREMEFDRAFYLLQEYATYDISILELLDRFPEPFLSKLNSISIDIENRPNDEILETSLFALRNSCTINDAEDYLKLTQDIFDKTNQQQIELLRDKIGLKPSIVLD